MEIAFKKVKILVMSFLIFFLSSIYSSQEHKAEEFIKFTSYNLGFGARALGMGGAFISIADDATASYWNPAGIAQLIKPEFSFSFSYTNYTHKYPGYGYTEYYPTYYRTYERPSFERKNSGFTFDFFSLAFPFKLGDYNLAMQLSYQRNINPSIDSEYEYSEKFNYYYSTYLSIYDYYLHHIELNAKGGFDTLTVSLASSVFPNLYLGFGINKWLSKQVDSWKQKSYVEVGTYKYTYEWDWNPEYKLSGINFGLGILFKYSNFSVGGVFKSPFTSRVKYTEKQEYMDSEGDSGHGNYSGDWKIKWPYSAGIGVSYCLFDRLTIATNFIRTNWSKARYINYNKSGKFVCSWADDDYYDFYKPELTFPGKSDDLESQKDVNQIRFGIEYLLFAGSNIIPIRFGFFTDPYPTKDDAGKQIKFYGITLGGGISIGDILLDFAYVSQRGKLNILTGTTTYKKTSVNMHTFFFSFIYRPRFF